MLSREGIEALQFAIDDVLFPPRFIVMFSVVLRGTVLYVRLSCSKVTLVLS